MTVSEKLRLVQGLHSHAEIFGFKWDDDSDWTWHDVACKIADEVDAENAKLRELAVLNWEWAHSCCGNNCKMQTNECGYQIDRDCNYEREIWDLMRELGVEVPD